MNIVLFRLCGNTPAEKPLEMKKSGLHFLILSLRGDLVEERATVQARCEIRSCQYSTRVSYPAGLVAERRLREAHLNANSPLEQ